MRLSLLSQIIDTFERVFFRHTSEVFESYTSTIQKSHLILQKLTHQENLFAVTDKILHSASDDIKEAYEELMAYGKYYDEFTVLGKVNFKTSYYFYYRRKKEHRKAFVCLTQAIQLFEEHPHFISHQLVAYLSLWHNAMIISIHSNCINMALEYYTTGN